MTEMVSRLAPTAPVLVFICGVPNSGKSSVAAGLVADGYAHIEVDAIRKRCCGTAKPSAQDAKIWPVLCRQIRANLASGNSVVVDSTGAAPQVWAAVFDASAPPIVLALDCDPVAYGEREHRREDRRDGPVRAGWMRDLRITIHNWLPWVLDTTNLTGVQVLAAVRHRVELETRKTRLLARLDSVQVVSVGVAPPSDIASLWRRLTSPDGPSMVNGQPAVLALGPHGRSYGLISLNQAIDERIPFALMPRADLIVFDLDGPLAPHATRRLQILVERSGLEGCVVASGTFDHFHVWVRCSNAQQATYLQHLWARQLFAHVDTKVGQHLLPGTGGMIRPPGSIHPQFCSQVAAPIDGDWQRLINYLS